MILMKKHLLLAILFCAPSFGQITYTNVNVGSASNDGAGDTLRSAFQKINYTLGVVTEALSEVESVTAFEAVGDGVTDDTDSINAAITAIFERGGGRVVVPSGRYKVNGQIVLKDGVELVGINPHSVTLDFTDSTATNAFILAEGSITTLPELAAQIDFGATQVEFASAPDLEAGDLYFIHSTNSTSFAGAFYAGEFFRSDGVNGSVVTNRGNGSYDTYATGADKVLKKVSPVRVAVRGMSMRFKQGVSVSGIKVLYGQDCVFEDLDLSGSRYAQIEISHCYNTSFRGVKATDSQTAAGLNYGIVCLHSQVVRAQDCYLETTRHGWATGGNVAGPVNRDILLSDSYIGTTARNQFGLDFHAPAEHATVDNCSLPNGFVSSADFVTVRGSRIRGNSGTGQAIYVGMNGDANFTAENNEIHAEADLTGSSTALVQIFTEENTTEANITVRNNRVSMYDFVNADGPTRGIHIYRENNGGTNDTFNVIVERNEISSTLTSATTVDRWAIDVVPQATKGFTTAIVRDNIARGAGISVWANVREGTISGNQVFDAIYDGVWVQPMTTPSYSTQTWHVTANKVFRALRSGIHVYLNSSDVALIYGNTSLNNGLDTTATASRRTSLFVDRAGKAFVEGNYFGDTAASPTQQNITRFQNVGTLYRADNRNAGYGVNSLADSFSSVTSSKVLGGSGGEVRTVTGAYTANFYDETIQADTSAGGYSIILPSSTFIAGKKLNVKKISSDSNTLTIDASSTETIDGSLTQATTNQWGAFRLQSTGAGWILL